MAERITSPFGAKTTAREVAQGHDLSGRTAIVTGAATGIGVETARALALAGAEVIIAGCTEVPLVLGPGDVTVPLIDSTDVLARRTVEVASNNVAHIA